MAKGIEAGANKNGTETRINPLSFNSEHYLFKHSSDENKRSDLQG